MLFLWGMEINQQCRVTVWGGSRRTANAPLTVINFKSTHKNIFIKFFSFVRAPMLNRRNISEVGRVSPKLALIKKASVDGTRDCQVISHSRNLWWGASHRHIKVAMIKKDEKCLKAMKICFAVCGRGRMNNGPKKKDKRAEMRNE